MSTYKCKTPIVLIIFNREDTTRKVFERIKEVEPEELFIISDGPRENKVGENELVQATRDIIKDVSWKCNVHTNFSEKNLGCMIRVSTGLDWVFSQTEQAIILEDDCYPNISFFRYCDELLEKYKDNPEIMMISGNNNSLTECEESFYFTNYFHIWGWATWKRAWDKNETMIKSWPEFKKSQGLKKYFSKPSELYYWSHTFDIKYNNFVNSWAIGWVYSCYKNGGISIAPKYNLISNIGFGENATHTSGNSIYANVETKELDFPLQYPKSFSVNSQLDEIERKIRNKDSKRLPFPLQVIAGKIKWFIRGLRKK